ncbi:1-aminocyclopropane-1-carboxylate oxidase-1-like protein [Morus notabilis]|uniref:1-aminocyclopropane-1-carboxylate oxidase-1-like protein n=1 Tax=Morus notabilis TaxID=981085 RepID=W9S808_9ROSA|nr:1-aminocyclopropane-1-carboxylate oxidase homolog 1 [Morus notabilis]EXC16424.1 1-aminocyclopropane-1-carboxylate oxidase-1-like protein [Morus notabilis]
MADYDRIKELKQFDESRTGVKGLLDSGLNSIPLIFCHPPETLSDLKPSSADRYVSIPVVDLSGSDSDHRRAAVVEQVSRAARDFGFFQVVNHGIPLETLDRTIEALKAFHELPPEIRSRFYRREMGTGVSYLSNVDLFKSKAASWRDTLQVRLGPIQPEPGQVPEVCAGAVAEWDREVLRLGGLLLDFVGEGLGLPAGRFREMTCLEGRTLAGHYYPYCPEPDRTIGLATHADPGVLTVLIQDKVGGLQVNYGGVWVDVEPVPGALVVNIGDLLQIMSNDEYKSVEHRVSANSCQEPRVSIAVFLNPGDRKRMFGPLPELISLEKPAAYRQFKYPEFIQKFFSRELDGKPLRNYFRL